MWLPVELIEMIVMDSDYLIFIECFKQINREYHGIIGCRKDGSLLYKSCSGKIRPIRGSRYINFKLAPVNYRHLMGFHEHIISKFDQFRKRHYVKMKGYVIEYKLSKNY